jgi:hypothetical protein
VSWCTHMLGLLLLVLLLLVGTDLVEHYAVPCPLAEWALLMKGHTAGLQCWFSQLRCGALPSQDGIAARVAWVTGCRL